MNFFVSQSRSSSPIRGISTMGFRVIFILASLGIVQGKLIKSCNDTKSFVDGHNARRLQLAKGEVPGQPAASQMTSIVWDEELATKARKWASKNLYKHNPNRTIPSGRFTVGENIYQFGTTAKDITFDSDMAMKTWWDEYKDYTYGPLAKRTKGAPQTLHYTQMAWEKTTRVGCGMSKYKKNEYTMIFVVCDYGPAGNVIGQEPYKSDDGTSDQLVCGEADCSQMYGDKC